MVYPDQVARYVDYALISYIIGIGSLGLAALWQMYIMLSETYTLNRFASNNKAMMWAAISLFFTFSLSIYIVCPNARKKGILFFLLGGIGVIAYGLGLYFGKLAHSTFPF